MGDAKVLLTLAFSSFEKNNIQAMKRYFSSQVAISVGSKVTFLKPDKSPSTVIKKIECRNYSFNSHAVLRGNVVSVSKDRRHIRVGYYSQELDKVVKTKVPMVQAFNSKNVYVNEGLLISAKEHSEYLGMCYNVCTIDFILCIHTQTYVCGCMRVCRCRSATSENACGGERGNLVGGVNTFYIVDIFTTTNHGSQATRQRWRARADPQA